MRYFLIANELETTQNSAKYKRKVKNRKLHKKEKILSNTTPADSSVEIMYLTDDDYECNELICSGAIEQTQEQHDEWERVKKEILKAQELLNPVEEIII